jgi:hypothetical protein
VLAGGATQERNYEDEEENALHGLSVLEILLCSPLS